MATPDPDRPGFLLPLLLLAGFRTLIDDLHAELARQGHPDLRPLHGFVLQAVGNGTTASELGQRLGVSKQAAGKTVDRLVALGYLERADDPADARRKLVRPTTGAWTGCAVPLSSSTSSGTAGRPPSAPTGSRPSRTTCAAWSRPTSSASTCPAGSAPDTGSSAA